MIRRNQSNINGFISPRRVTLKQLPPKDSYPQTNETFSVVPKQPPMDDITESLAKLSLVSDHSISDLEPKKPKRFFHRPSKRRVKWAILIIILALLIGGGTFAWKVLESGSKIFKGNIFNAVSSLVEPDKALKTDANGNTNILLLGTSESDPNHPGAQLTDSMMVISVNKTSHTAFLLSIPRDLWVKGNGQCAAGYQYKINAVYECYLSSSLGGLSSLNTDEATAETNTASKVGDIVGVNINYVVHMNLAVIQQVVDAVGGIDITIDSPDPRGILDRNFDWRCSYKCYLVKYPNGPAHLSGADAMWLAQARNDSGGYGLPRSNFDRDANQRKILIATRDKATSVGFLANPLNSVNLLNALGNNIHTTVDSSEIKSFVDLAKDIPSNNITSIDILDNRPGVLTTGTGPDGSSIVEPVAGLINYSDLQAFVSTLLAGYAPVVADAAPIDVINASRTTGAAQTKAESLNQKGYTIGQVRSAPSTYTNTSKYTIIDLSKGAKSGTLTMLEKDLGVTTTQTNLPDGITSTATFVVILGDTSSKSTQ